ncbi:high affinity immunoglobulin gamma Fc receptor I-like [Alosa pseudoharengus]|uniref:high affinity immunoglobulin gamma Fc receptor I-like n=1 Tax=Alosa pseudoharengus TaxID=34774 RepID=UPI003F8BCE21
MELCLLLVLSLCSYSGLAAANDTQDTGTSEDGVTPKDSTALPTATVTIEPQSSVYVGEEVTLKCEIQPKSGWMYKWFKGSSSDHLSQPDTSTLTITAAAKSDESRYWCQGEMKDRAVSSLMSGHIYLAVKGLPTAAVTVESPQPPFYPGETVTLRCDIAEYTDWNQYFWYKGDKQIPDQNGKNITISGSNYAGQYRCKGWRGGRPRNSQRSASFPISVTALPTPTLSVQPESPVFTGEEVTLKCEIEPEGVWKYKWYKDWSKTLLPQLNTNKYTITSAAESNKGQYWCQGERIDRPKASHTSSTINIGVKGKYCVHACMHFYERGRVLKDCFFYCFCAILQLVTFEFVFE